MELSRNVEWSELTWLNHCRDSALPYRSDFDQVNDDFQFVLEMDDDGNLRMRQVGLFLDALFGGTLAGREFASLFDEPHRPYLNKELKAVFEKPSKLYLNTMTEDGDVQFGILPVSADYGPVNYAIGAVSLEAVPEHSVFLLGIHQMESISLLEEKKDLKYGFAEDRAGFGGAPRSPFKLIQGGGAAAPRSRPGLKVIQHIKREP